ncbi:hypothetical protein P886_0472 [Alteromonadaceae bacterium 2753L.S.0a.02]|nr:hypothetical protein P886_0472 [Alteromonadaceae bacterium 2753L.S.0a.02]
MHFHKNTIAQLILDDPYRLELLKSVAALRLPDWYIAAGFVRNLVWDHLHNFVATPLNDVDVIYFDKTNRFKDVEVCKALVSSQPGINWQAKNQANIHSSNGYLPYRDSEHAMTFWPEKETAIAVRFTSNGQITVTAPFGTKSLFEGKITHNPIRDKSIFLRRIESKQWLQHWPKLVIA